MKKHQNKSLQIIFNLYTAVLKSLRNWTSKSRSWIKHVSAKSVMNVPLTSLNKKSRVSNEGSVFFVWIRKQFQSIRKAITGSYLEIFHFLNQRLPKGRKVKVVAVVNLFNGFNGFRSLAVVCVLASSAVIVACGGGGGAGVVSVGTTSTPLPEPVLFVRSGADVANAPVLTIVSMSPLPVASSITVSSNVALVGISGVSITTPQSTTLPGNSALSADKKTLTITMNAPLPYGTTLTVTVKATANGMEGTVTGTILTESAPVAVTCTSPSVWTAGVNACVYPMGVKVYLDAKTAPAGAITNATFPGQTQSGLLPPECRLHTDACWKEAVRNGTVSFVSTSALNLNTPTRPTVFGSYKTVDTIFWPGQNKVMACEKSFYADDGSYSDVNQFVENRCSSEDETIYHIGNSLGEIFLGKKISTGVSTCFQKKFVQIVSDWQEFATPCP